MIGRTNKKSVSESREIYNGFLKLNPTEQQDYLRYFSLFIERNRNENERKKLLRFKAKLERKICAKVLKILEKQGD